MADTFTTNPIIDNSNNNDHTTNTTNPDVVKILNDIMNGKFPISYFSGK